MHSLNENFSLGNFHNGIKGMIYMRDEAVRTVI